MAQANSMAHENHFRREEITLSTERSFGTVFTIFFLIIALWPTVFQNTMPRLWAIAAALILAWITWKLPSRLRPANVLWHKFGLLLGRVVSPIALAIVFFAVVTPLGVLARWRGKDFLKLQKDPDAATYWQPRDPPGPAPESLDRQF